MVEIKEAESWKHGDPIYSLIGIGNVGSEVVDRVENTYEHDGIDYVKLQKGDNSIMARDAVAIIADLNEKDCFDVTVEVLDSIRKDRSRWCSILFLIVIDYDHTDNAKIEMLESKVNHLISIENELCRANKTSTVDVLYKCTYSLVVPILAPSLIGMDYADYVNMFKKGTSSAWFGFGSSKENNHIDAANIAMGSKLVRGNISDYSYVWVYLYGDVSLIQANEVANHVLESTHIKDENILFQCNYDEAIENEARVYIIAF